MTHIHADFADKKDNQCLRYLTEKLRRRFKTLDLDWKYLTADAGYSSGDNYAYLERRRIESYIPPHGTYKGGPEGFQYVKDGDYWLCSQGKKVKFHRIMIEKKNDIKKRRYFTRRAD
ncbi:MAG: transposase, partial [Candidatus Pacebacteria bacterium]|nr:transposase [Candidatus Paceibacterota bacterium]